MNAKSLCSNWCGVLQSSVRRRRRRRGKRRVVLRTRDERLVDGWMQQPHVRTTQPNNQHDNRQSISQTSQTTNTTTASQSAKHTHKSQPWRVCYAANKCTYSDTVAASRQQNNVLPPHRPVNVPPHHQVALAAACMSYVDSRAGRVCIPVSSCIRRR